MENKNDTLTDKGRNKLAKAFEAQLAFQTSFFDDCLSKEEQKTLLSLMPRVQKRSEEKFLVK